MCINGNYITEHDVQIAYKMASKKRTQLTTLKPFKEAEEYWKRDLMEERGPLCDEPWVLPKLMEYDQELDDLEMTQCCRCKRIWPVPGARLDRYQEHICETCRKSDRGKQVTVNGVTRTVYKFSKENDMHIAFPKEYRWVFTDLTQVEKQLVAAIISVARIRITASGMKAQEGGQVNIPQSLCEMAKVLPNLPQDCKVMVVTEDVDADLGQFRDLYVSKKRVKNFLELMVRMENPWYRDIEIDYNRIEQLPENGMC